MVGSRKMTGLQKWLPTCGRRPSTGTKTQVNTRERASEKASETIPGQSRLAPLEASRRHAIQTENTERSTPICPAIRHRRVDGKQRSRASIPAARAALPPSQGMTARTTTCGVGAPKFGPTRIQPLLARQLTTRQPRRAQQLCHRRSVAVRNGQGAWQHRPGSGGHLLAGMLRRSHADRDTDTG
jgi:hypothetical protein